MHPDDDFHPPTSDDPFWSETCWFAFSVPERRLSGWFYPFFRPNLGVCSAAVFLWDDHGDQPWNCRYFKQFWHLPMPEGPLSDCTIANGIRYRALESGKVYELSYRDPDGDELAIDLTFTAVMDALSTKSSGPAGGHLDQLGRFQGTIVLDGETIAVDSYGARDRSWGSRSQFGQKLMSSGSYQATEMPYSHGTSDTRAFQTITANVTDDYPLIMGFQICDGELSRLTSGRRAILERDAATGGVTRVLIEGVDELGRELRAVGECMNRFTAYTNENLAGWNYLVRWDIDGVEAWGEQHENYSAWAIRKFARAQQGWPA